MKMSIIIPCYNELGNLELLLHDIGSMKKYTEIQFVLVENGSSDASREYLLEHTDKMPNVKLVLVDQNRGYGYGIVQGLNAAQGQYLGWTHGDGQLDVKDVLKAYHYLEREGWKDFYYIKGNRSRKKRSLLDNVLTSGMSIIVSLVLDRKLVDINGQPNIFPKSFYEGLKDIPDDVMIEVFMYYSAVRKGLKVRRFSVDFQKREYGESKLTPHIKSKIRTIKRTVSYSIMLKKSKYTG